jgi:hypothetical protein
MRVTITRSRDLSGVFAVSQLGQHEMLLTLHAHHISRLGVQRLAEVWGIRHDTGMWTSIGDCCAGRDDRALWTPARVRYRRTLAIPHAACVVVRDEPGGDITYWLHGTHFSPALVDAWADGEEWVATWMRQNVHIVTGVGEGRAVA